MMFYRKLERGSPPRGPPEAQGPGSPILEGGAQAPARGPRLAGSAIEEPCQLPLCPVSSSHVVEGW